MGTDTDMVTKAVRVNGHLFFSRKWTVLLFAFQILLAIVGEAVLADVQPVAGDPLGDDRHGARVGEVLLTRAALVDVVLQHVTLQVTRVRPGRVAQRTLVWFLSRMGTHVLLQISCKMQGDIKKLKYDLFLCFGECYIFKCEIRVCWALTARASVMMEEPWVRHCMIPCASTCGGKQLGGPQ